MRLPEQLHSTGRESLHVIPDVDVPVLLQEGIVEPADWRDSAGWVVPYSVAEDNPTGKRRRWIAWPH